MFYNAKSANSVYPTNLEEGKARVMYWIKAHNNIEVLISIVEMFIDLPGGLSYHDENTGKTKHITTDELINLLKLIRNEEIELTKAIKRDREKYVNKYK